MKLGSCLDANKKNVPGPGNYDPEAIYSNIRGGRIGIKFTAGGSLQNIPTNPNLGPGSYNIDNALGHFDSNSRNNKNKSTFGSSRSTFKSKMNNPGPGMYSINKCNLRNSHCFVFGSSKRPDIGIKKNIEVPGPG